MRSLNDGWDRGMDGIAGMTGIIGGMGGITGGMSGVTEVVVLG